jgi:short-subunit dehydrogenase
MTKVVVITGASSGIGKELALRYAREHAVLGLIGRDPARLEAVAEQCRSLGADVQTGRIDVRNGAELAEWLVGFDTAHPVDLLIANAGVAAGTQESGAHETADLAALQVETNLAGALNAVHPLLPRMLARSRGQIALMSSIAALVPLQDSPSYGATKAAILYYGQAMREALRGSGVGMSVICSGFFTSGAMAGNYRGWRPLEMSAQAAAERVARGLVSDRAVIAFPWLLAFGARIAGIMPAPLRRPFLIPFRFAIDREPGDN